MQDELQNATAGGDAAASASARATEAGRIQLGGATRVAGAAPVPALPRRLRGIDVARAFAATAVLVNHLVLAVTERNPAWKATASPVVVDWITRSMVAMGAWGVGLFFVLSGLCIHLPMARRLAADPGARLDAKPYFARRFTRIYPPHLVALLVSALVAMALPAAYVANTFLSKPTWEQLLAHLAMVHSLIPGYIYSISSVLWTIALETHFYLLYPALLMMRRKMRIETICLVLFVVSLLVRVASKGVGPDWSLVLDQSFARRYWEWCLGCVIAERLVRQPRVDWIPQPLTTAFLALSYAFGVAIVSFPMGGALRSTVWPLLFALAIELAARQKTSEGAVERGIFWIGHSSYTLYLTHPFALAVGIFAARSLGAPWWGEALAGLAATIVVWVAFFYRVEKPFLHRAAKAAAPAAPPAAVALG